MQVDIHVCSISFLMSTLEELDWWKKHVIMAVYCLLYIIWYSLTCLHGLNVREYSYNQSRGSLSLWYFDWRLRSPYRSTDMTACCRGSACRCAAAWTNTTRGYWFNNGLWWPPRLCTQDLLKWIHLMITLEIIIKFRSVKTTANILTATASN